MGVSIIVWLAAIFCTAFFGTLFSEPIGWGYDYEEHERYSRDSSDDYYSDGGHCLSGSESSTQRNLTIVTLVFLAIVGVLPFSSLSVPARTLKLAKETVLLPRL